MKISETMIEKLLTLLIIVVEFIKKRQDKDDENNDINSRIAALSRQAHPDMDDMALISYYQNSITNNKILNEA